MFRTKKVKAEIIEVLSCAHRTAVYRDYDGEYYADHDSLYRYPGERWNTHNTCTSWEREDNLYEYSRRRSNCQVRRNEWTGELELYREASWYEIKLRIKYTVSDVSYENEIEIQSQTSEIKEVRVYYNKKSPEKIVDIAYR